MRLTAGEFLGAPLRRRAAGGFVFTQYEYRAGLSLPAHEHESAYISMPLAGAYHERVGTTLRSCVAGQPVFHPAAERHADRFSDAGATIFSIEIDGRWIARLRDCGVGIDRRMDLSRPAVAQRARHLVRLLASPAVSPLRIDAAAVDLLAAVVPPARGLPPRWMKRVEEALRETRPSLDDLASIAGVHAVHLARTFRAVHGCSVGEYVRRQRIERALDLLRTDESLVSIALSCGFADQSHFTRELRRATGLTPRQWRSKRASSVQDAVNSRT
jgi:AraC family transcriptional regulator